MKAAFIERFGGPGVVDVVEIPKPTPNTNQLLVKVHASAVTIADSRIRGSRFPKGFKLFAKMVFGFKKPRVKVLGSCFSGIIEQVGDGVVDFKKGQEVCGMNGIKMGAHAQYMVVSPKTTVLKPKSVTHSDVAGALFGGTTSLNFLYDKMKVSKKDAVLINGASGAVGTNAVQIAKYFGANVTGVTSKQNTNLVKKLGADKTIDYQKTTIDEINEKYDVILDCVGNISPKQAKRLLLPNGRASLIVASLGQIVGTMFNKNIFAGSASEKKTNIELVAKLLKDKKLKTVIDRTYYLDQIVSAYEKVDSGKKVGNVVLLIDNK